VASQGEVFARSVLIIKMDSVLCTCYYSFIGSINKQITVHSWPSIIDTSILPDPIKILKGYLSGLRVCGSSGRTPAWHFQGPYFKP
jgi:hypothetical protein